jgi:hypothetical protein
MIFFFFCYSAVRQVMTDILEDLYIYIYIYIYIIVDGFIKKQLLAFNE